MRCQMPMHERSDYFSLSLVRGSRVEHIADGDCLSASREKRQVDHENKAITTFLMTNPS